MSSGISSEPVHYRQINTVNKYNLINASALAKVILIGQKLNLADQFLDAPLIYPTLLKSFVYTVLLASFKIAEGAVIGMNRGWSFVVAGGSWKGLLSLSMLLFVVLIPFFGFAELRRVFGEDIVRAFLRPRHLLTLPPLDSGRGPN